MPDPNEERLRVLQEEIALRLAPVCQGWPEALFATLVRDIAVISMKYDHRGIDDIDYDPRIVERMAADMKALADISAQRRRNTPH